MYRGGGTVKTTYQDAHCQRGVLLIKAIRPDFEPTEGVVTADTKKAFEIAGQADPRPDMAATRARLAGSGVNHIAKRWDCNFRDACLLLAICLKTSLEEVARYVESGEPESFMSHWCRAVEHLERYYPKGWRLDDDDIPTDEDE